MATNGSFPIFLTAKDMAILVVGDGAAADAKARYVTGIGAELRRFRDPTEVTAAAFEGARLAIVANDDAAEALRIVALARAAGVLVNVLDRPEWCDFILPAMVERPPITIAIGTGGAAPALARDLRITIEAAIPEAWGSFAALWGRWRERVAASLPEREARRAFWDAVLDGPETRAALDDDLGEAERLLAQRLAGGTPGPRIGRLAIITAEMGDPGELRLRELRILKRADLVLHRPPGNPALLALVRREAEILALTEADAPALIAERVSAGDLVVILRDE
jgi:uroporphyrin-III C-methyltransferase/precorrin-2 dehydrogenase/sirohydrochlorin ferrochelatase